MYGYDHYTINNTAFAFLEHIAISDYFDINGANKTGSLKSLSWHKYFKNNTKKVRKNNRNYNRMLEEKIKTIY